MAGEQSLLDRFWGIFAPPRAPPVPVSRPLPPAPGVPVPKPQFSPDYPDEYADQSSPASTPSMHGVVQNIQLMKELGLGIPPPGARQSDRVQDDRDERGDHRSERGRHDEGHRELDQVAAEHEIPETLEH